MPIAKCLLPILALLPALLSLPAPAADETAATAPALVVFDFESAWDAGMMGRKVAEMFRGHAQRRRAFTLLDPLTFEELLEACGRTVNMESTPEEVSELARESFSSEVAIWGKLERIEDDRYRLHVRVMDSRKDPAALALDEVYASTRHGIQLSVDKALDAILSRPQQVDKDVVADVSWRNRKNLCPNGDFELGDVSPLGWERVDGLGTFWVEKGASPTGRCVMMDTDVLDSQYRAWRKLFEASAAAADAPKKLPTRPPYYDTIGGIAGAHLYSDRIPIRPGRAYRLDLDVRGPSGNAKCFVKGYAAYARADSSQDYREVYRAQINLNMRTKEDDWEHFARIFHPSQPLLLLVIRSDFDGDRSGERLRALLANRFLGKGAMETRDVADVLESVREKEHLIRVEAPKQDIAHVVASCFGSGVAVWGELFQEEDLLQVRVRSLDVRPGGTATKDWWRTWETTPEGLGKTADEIARAVLENARPVAHLKIKLDAYWPVGQYYFDNVTLTEEPRDGE